VKPENLPAADCPHFGPCGGCSLLHLPYEQELAEKERRLRASIAEHPFLRSARIEPILAADQPHEYRTSLKVPFARTKSGPVAGFYERGSHRIVNLLTCRIQHPVLTELLQVVRELVTSCAVPVYHEHLHRGILRHLVARIGAGTNEVLAGFVVRRSGAPQVKRMAWQLYERFRRRGLVGVVEFENPEQTNAIFGGERTRQRRLVGRSVMFEESGGLLLRTNLRSFAQVNAAQAEKLFERVLERIGEVEGLRIAELYSGYGPIGLRLAQRGAQVVAVERNPMATQDGAAIARANQLADRIRFVTADAAVGLRAAAVQGPIDALVADPARRGLARDVVGALLELRVPRMIYVSCNPDSLFRDLGLLAGAYETLFLEPVDLFPRTEHVEVIATLRAASHQ